MSERDFEKHVPEGIKKHIAHELKPKIRDEKTSESEAWQLVEKIIAYQVEGWPEKFRHQFDLINDYNKAAYAASHDLPAEEKLRRDSILDEYDQEEFTLARPVLRVIRQAYQ